jgi:hypothetical protein
MDKITAAYRSTDMSQKDVGELSVVSLPLPDFASTDAVHFSNGFESLS